MQIIRQSSSLPLGSGPYAVGIGIFDGVHRGHHALLQRTLELAGEEGIASLAYTFHPHPTKVLSPRHAPPLIEPLEQRLERLGSFGLDATLVEPFTNEFAAISPAAFVRDILAGRLGARHVVVGENFTFGARAAGDVELLTELGGELGFEVHPFALLKRDTQTISSTAIRALVGAGDVCQAADMLGRPFALCGQVVRGAGRGRTIALPTANVETRNELLPAVGVYATWAHGPFGKKPAVTNVGYAPTFNGDKLRIEAHLLDGDPGILYGEILTLDFVARLRGEEKFAGADALLEQVQRDIAAARELLDG